MGKVECLVNMAEILVGCLGGSFTRVDINGAVKKMGNFRFCIGGYAWRVSLCFMSL